MDFGRVPNVEVVDFSLPDAHPLSKKTFEKLDSSQKPSLYIGCPVWADKGYVGKVYPPKTQAKNYLREYCKQFNSIEVNATHYQIPKEDTIKKWKDVATKGFKFCPKFPQIISHRNDFDNRDEWVDLFLSSIYQLDEFLGISFIQFPPHFKIDKIEKLDRFLKKLPHDMSFAVELRHESWFSNDKVKSEWFDLFSRYNITPVITDTSGRRDVLHQIVTNDKIFVRFTGNNLHATDYKRIDDWIQKITDWLSSGISEFYFFLHEPTKHLCADIAIYMAEKLKKSVKIDIQKPHIYTDNIVKLF